MAMARRGLIERRRELGLTQQQLAEALGADVKTVHRYEHGLSAPRPGQRRRLADALQWTPAQLAISLSDEPQSVNGHAVPGWLGHLASLEQGAGRLCAFEVAVVHGLLQTASYAVAIESVGPDPIPDEVVARKVETRMARQAVLHREPDPLALSVILDESVLYRVAVGRDTMADQLDHLLEVSQWPNVDLQILPFTAAGVFSAAFGAFTVFTSPGSSEPYMACVEDRAGPHYLDRPHEVEAHTRLFRYLTKVALSPADSFDLITRAKENHQ